MDLDRLQDIRDYIQDTKREQETLISKLESYKEDKERLTKSHMAAKEAQVILQSVAAETQKEIEDHVSTVVTMALSAVEVDDESVPKPPEFVARIVERRDATEFDLLFKEGEREQLPKECSGFGYVDIADYSLRIAYILLKIEYCKDDLRKTLLLDEPFRNADPKLQYKISEMLEMVSNELGFQQIIVSHAEGVNINAETLIKVTKKGKTSHISK